MGATVSRDHAKLPFGYTHPRKDHSFASTTSASRRRLATRILRTSDITSITPFPIQDGASSLASVHDLSLSFANTYSLPHSHQNPSINSSSNGAGNGTTGGEYGSLSSVQESGTTPEGQAPLVPESESDNASRTPRMRSLLTRPSQRMGSGSSSSHLDLCTSQLPSPSSSTVASASGSSSLAATSSADSLSQAVLSNHTTSSSDISQPNPSASCSSQHVHEAHGSTSSSEKLSQPGMQENQDNLDIVPSLAIADRPAYNFFSSTTSTNSCTCSSSGSKGTCTTSPTCSPRLDPQELESKRDSLLFAKGSRAQPPLQGEFETQCSSHGCFPRSDFRGHPAFARKHLPYEVKQLHWQDEQDFIDSWDDNALRLECAGEADSILDEELGHLSPIPFSDLPSLTNIGMCSQGIVKLSSNIRFLSSATCVQICCNELSVIPGEIGYLRNLTLLDLSKNNLTSLPESIMHLTKLVDLKLSFNQLKSIPAGIGGLSKLVALALDNNHLDAVPRQIGLIKGLVSLDLSNNPIKVLPAEVGKLQFLRRLTLEGCPLVEEFQHTTVHSPPTLLELAARVMVRHDIKPPASLHPHLKDYLKSARTCTYCEGPFFESFVTRGKLVEKNDMNIPLEYTLCMPHWNTEMERIKLMFCKRPVTAPPVKPIVGSQTTVGHISVSRKAPSRSESASKLAVSSSSSTSQTNGQQQQQSQQQAVGISPPIRRRTMENERPLSIGNRLSMLLTSSTFSGGSSSNNNNNKRERPASRYRASSQPVVSSARNTPSSSTSSTATLVASAANPASARATEDGGSPSRPTARRATTSGILSRAVFRLKRPLSMASAMETTSAPVGNTDASGSSTDSE